MMNGNNVDCIEKCYVEDCQYQSKFLFTYEFNVSCNIFSATVPDEPRRVILSEDDDDEVVVIEMKDRELSQPEGIRNWFCCLCPIHLASSDEIHVLVPCGHVLCKDCSEGVEYCPNPGCRKEVSKIAMPNIQRDETGSISTSQVGLLLSFMLGVMTDFYLV